MRKRDITITDVDSFADSFIRRYPKSGETTVNILKMYAEGADLQLIADKFSYDASVIYNMVYKFKTFCARTRIDVKVAKPSFMYFLTDDTEEYLFILFLVAAYEDRNAEMVNIKELPNRFIRLNDKEYRRRFIEHLSKVKVEFTNTGNPVIELFVQCDNDVVKCKPGMKTVLKLFRTISIERNTIHFEFAPQVTGVLNLYKTLI